ncbi:hypothetical protein EYF80_062728 [Liparis tanakae]|uniref:Secreted protein n=1 Tax=Liparis tanakae TaxID=230148 RepID=A0A4Z2EEZ7_9TELE|nr:hypothetical protein EYF80_062728 [Liparis tanakae]
MEGASLLQEAVVLVCSLSDLTLAGPQQVIEADVAVVDLQPQHLVHLGRVAGELVLPPRVTVVAANVTPNTFMGWNMIPSEGHSGTTT